MSKDRSKRTVSNTADAMQLLIPEFTIVAEKWYLEAKKLWEKYPELRDYHKHQWRMFTLLARIATAIHMPWLKLLVDEFIRLREKK